MITVRAPDDVARAVHRIYALVRGGHRVLAVSSQPAALRVALREAGLDAHCAETTWDAPGAGTLPPFSTRRLRVALLGHGTVGSGLYRRLAALPEHFTVTAIAVRDVNKAERAGAPRWLLHDDCWRALETPCDVVVELIGGTAPAAQVIEASLRAGRSLVTANKAVIAARGPALEAVARENGVRLLYSASVGGAMPALETVQRLSGSVVSFCGVLNATSNFVLDQMSRRGLSLSAAVALAQREGYAEADPRLDLDGTDAMQKLIILARAAFGRAPEQVFQRGIEQVEPGAPVRLLASCDAHRAEVSPQALPGDHLLASCAGAENRLVLQLRSGPPLVLSGTGAGRWPTAEAVLADLFDLAEVRDAERSAA